MSDLVKEGREKLEGVSGDPWHTSDEADISTPEDDLFQVVHLPPSVEDELNANFIAWSRNNMAALLDQIEAKDKELLRMHDYQHVLDGWNRVSKENKLMTDVVEAAKFLLELKRNKDTQPAQYQASMPTAWRKLEEALKNHGAT